MAAGKETGQRKIGGEPSKPRVKHYQGHRAEVGWAQREQS
jgi:hypothetical protein